MMSKKDEITGFWEPGFSIFKDGLAKEERERFGPLMAELKTTTDTVRKSALIREIAAIKAEFKTKRRNARCSLFTKT